MGSDEKRLITSGGVTGSFWVMFVGFKLAFPDMIVPFGWALALVAVGIVGLIATAAFAIRAYLPEPQMPPRPQIAKAPPKMASDHAAELVVHQLAMAGAQIASSFEQLLKRREKLAGEKQGLERSLEVVREALERYRNSIVQFSREKVIRPTMIAENPENTFPQAVAAFRNVGLKDTAWENEFERPKPVYSEWANPGVADRGDIRLMFDPAENERYLSKQRQNLVILEEAMEEAGRDLQKLNAELATLEVQIQHEASQ